MTALWSGPYRTIANCLPSIALNCDSPSPRVRSRGPTHRDLSEERVVAIPFTDFTKPVVVILPRHRASCRQHEMLTEQGLTDLIAFLQT